MFAYGNGALSDVDFRQEFLKFALDSGAIRFGDFVTKAGRHSPYFFNAGGFHTGQSLARLTEFYAKALLASELEFDLLFGPAYKGIPLVAGVAIALARLGRDVPFAFNRKEEKDHGEGGSIVGAALKGRVMIVDDVISAGTSVRESVGLIRQAGATPAGVVISLDRQERGQGALSATQEVEQLYAIPVLSVATLDDLVRLMHRNPSMSDHLQPVLAYRAQYGCGAA